eukprot:31440-Pelagococcus_subviridis.AAC.4
MGEVLKKRRAKRKRDRMGSSLVAVSPATLSGASAVVVATTTFTSGGAASVSASSGADSKEASPPPIEDDDEEDAAVTASARRSAPWNHRSARALSSALRARSAASVSSFSRDADAVVLAAAASSS